LGYRLTKIYTRTGDDGTTGLGDGRRVDKCDALVEAFGSVDEMNSLIGLLLAEADLPAQIRASLLRIQHDLFEVGGELALPGYVAIRDEHIERLESELDAFNAELPPLTDFILPGGNRPAALCHVARSACRRAERRSWSAAKQAQVRPETLRYLNRLSDLLFVVARCLARQRGGTETLWQRG
jgi:cob(I)alamin adenosyltransferase